MRHMERDRESFTQILEMTPDTRRAIERAISSLVDLLDEVDAPAEDMEDDCDLEEGDSDDEPSLAAPEPRLTIVVTERDPDGRALSWHEVYGDQTAWCWGGDRDLEHEHDGREPEEAA